MSWAVNRVTEPTAEALTTTEAKAHLRVLHPDEDTLIAGYSKTWREWLEERTNRTYVKSTWDYFQDRWPDGSDPIELPRGPLISVTSVKYTTTSATTTRTLSATSYTVDTASEPARIGLKSGQAWPVSMLRSQNGVEVRYNAGFATSATGVPQRAKHALRLLVGSAYVNREAVIVGSINTTLKMAVDSLVSDLDARRYL